MYNLNQSLFIGCDISSEKNVISILLQDGTSVIKGSFDNDIQGTNKLVELIYSKIKEYHCSSFLLGVEATSNYQSHLLRYVAASKLNSEFDMHLYQFNARIIREFKKVYSPKSKTDPYDALIIAERLRFGNLPDEFIPFDKLEPLRRLTRSRFHIVKMIEKESNYFLSNLFIKISNYKKLPFSNTFGNTSIALITEFDIQDIENMPMESLVDFLILKSKDHFNNPEAYAKQVKQVIHNCYRIQPKLNTAINIILTTSLENIKAYKKSLKIINKSIERELDQFQCTLTSIPGIGPIFAATILAEIGNRQFKNNNSMAKFAGLTWQHKQSGNYSNEETRMQKSGDTYLRYSLIQAANSVKNYCPEFNAYYHKKYDETSKHKHKRALVLTARKLVRVIFILLRDNTLYNPSRTIKTKGGDL